MMDNAKYSPGFQKLLDLLEKTDMGLASVEDIGLRSSLKLLLHQATQQAERLANNLQVVPSAPAKVEAPAPAPRDDSLFMAGANREGIVVLLDTVEDMITILADDPPGQRGNARSNLAIELIQSARAWVLS